MRGTLSYVFWAGEVSKRSLVRGTCPYDLLRGLEHVACRGSLLVSCNDCESSKAKQASECVYESSVGRAYE